MEAEAGTAPLWLPREESSSASEGKPYVPPKTHHWYPAYVPPVSAMVLQWAPVLCCGPTGTPGGTRSILPPLLLDGLRKTGYGSFPLSTGPRLWYQRPGDASSGHSQGRGRSSSSSSPDKAVAGPSSLLPYDDFRAHQDLLKQVTTNLGLEI